MTWHVFSTCHCKVLNTRSFRWRRMIHRMPLFEKNQMRFNCFNALHKGWSKRHCIMEKDFHGPRFPLLARSCHMILAAYRHPCWARGQLKNLCSTNSTDSGPQWGQHLSISVEHFQRHSLTATALWMTDQRKAIFFLCLSFVPNDVPFRRSGGENFIPPLMWNRFLESLLLSNPFPPLLCRIHAKGSNL